MKANYHISFSRIPILVTPSDFKNFNDVLMHNFVQHRDTTAIIYTDGDRTQRFTYRQMSHQVYTVVNYLTTNGFEQDEHVVIWMSNCPEAIWADLGVTLAGGIITPLSMDTPAEEVIRILKLLKATYVFVASIEQLQAIQAQRAALPHLKMAVVQEAMEVEKLGIATFYWIMNFPTQINALGEVHTVREQRSSSAPLAIFFPTIAAQTPSTKRSANAKGVVCTHHNALAMAVALGDRLGIVADKKSLRFPLSQALDEVQNRMLGYYTMLYFAKTIVLAAPVSATALTAQIVQTQADLLCIDAQAMENWRAHLAQTISENTLMQWALSNGLKVAELELTGAPVTWFLRKKQGFYRKQRAKIKQKFAKTLQFVVVYGQPLETTSVYFYHALGWNVLQSFGELETLGFATLDDLNEPRPLTAGKALSGVEVEIERYGPIVVKGDTVFTAYFNDAKATAAAFDKQGFFACQAKGYLDNFRLVCALVSEARDTNVAINDEATAENNA